MYLKKIVGKKCYLSPIDENDSEKYAEWLNDLEMTQYLVGLGPINVNVGNMRGILESAAQGHNYSIIDIETNELLGDCCFEGLNHLNQTSEVGIYIGNKEYWDKGFGTEALSLLLDYGFKVLNLHCVYLQVVSFNDRAIKSYEKIGFEVVGKKREAILKGKERYDMIYMDILHNEFYEVFNEN
ncbi:MAG: GNAT family N-acetyltransferase [Lachnospiraceae bacterium]|jgi:RimJ/RimL family protein N-acetyltransferase|nr:GNAT family N-acetyltransferase [Lachnospiraceae bacterium]